MPELKSSDPTDILPLPTLTTSSPTTTHLKSHLTILFLLITSILGSYLLGFSLLQQSSSTTWLESAISLAALVGVGATALWWTGSHKIDWWELVLGYWWFSMPIAGAAGLLLIRAQEGSEEIGDVEWGEGRDAISSFDSGWVEWGWDVVGVGSTKKTVRSGPRWGKSTWALSQPSGAVEFQMRRDR